MYVNDALQVWWPMANASADWDLDISFSDENVP